MIPACRVMVSGPLGMTVSSGSRHLRVPVVAEASVYSPSCACFLKEIYLCRLSFRTLKVSECRLSADSML